MISSTSKLGNHVSELTNATAEKAEEEGRPSRDVGGNLEFEQQSGYDPVSTIQRRPWAWFKVVQHIPAPKRIR